MVLGRYHFTQLSLCHRRGVDTHSKGYLAVIRFGEPFAGGSGIALIILQHARLRAYELK